MTGLFRLFPSLHSSSWLSVLPACSAAVGCVGGGPRPLRGSPSVRTRATRDAGGADTRDAHGPGAGAAVPSEANGAGRDGGQRGGVVRLRVVRLSVPHPCHAVLPLPGSAHLPDVHLRRLRRGASDASPGGGGFWPPRRPAGSQEGPGHLRRLDGSTHRADRPAADVRAGRLVGGGPAGRVAAAAGVLRRG